eukprot:980337-Amphidinium_carterae.1
MASLIPCQPGAVELSRHATGPTGLSFLTLQQNHCQNEATTSTTEEEDETHALSVRPAKHVCWLLCRRDPRRDSHSCYPEMG